MKTSSGCGVRWAALVAAVAMAVVMPVQAATRYVSTMGNDGGDGLTWATAKKTVQAGLNAAASGDQVWVAAGTYVQCITLKAGVALYGGFVGTETDLGQRDWKANVAVLDANQGGSVVKAFSGAGTRIDGFTIRNGKATSGAGIYCSGASPTIANNTITSNIASSAGGAIYCYSYSSPTIENNTIVGNSATANGGGIFCNSSSAPTIAGNTIASNNGYDGGGIYCSYSSPMIKGNTIVGNGDHSSIGGGIYSYASSPTILSNTIADNTALAGGGLYCTLGLPSIANNIIAANSASTGGGIHSLNCSPMINNNTIAGNTGTSNGGAIYCSQSSPTIANTIIAFNSSGIYRYSSGAASPILRYSCVYGNTAYNFSGLTNPTGTNGNRSADPRFVRGPSVGADGVWGTGDDDYGDLRLLPGSACIDSANNSDAPAVSADLAGTGRVLDDPATADTGTGTPPIVDMGAYEYLCGDVSGNGHVDVVDLLSLADSWAKTAGQAEFNARCDFDGNGSVDVLDLLLLAGNWGE